MVDVSPELMNLFFQFLNSLMMEIVCVGTFTTIRHVDDVGQIFVFGIWLAVQHMLAKNVNHLDQTFRSLLPEQLH